jgi:hypothetical protein
MTWRAAYLPYRVKASRRGWVGLSTGASVVLTQVSIKFCGTREGAAAQGWARAGRVQWEGDSSRQADIEQQ